ncbi:hypothetical protein D3C83_270560 [compost metagenome]
MAVQETGQHVDLLRLGELGAVLVVLVLDLPEYLLEEVLDGDDAGGAAVLVDHYGHAPAV